MKGYVHAFTRLYRKAKAVAARDAHGVYIYIILIFIQLHRLISLSKDRTLNLLYLYATVHNRNRNSNPQAQGYSTDSGTDGFRQVLQRQAPSFPRMVQEVPPMERPGVRTRTRLARWKPLPWMDKVSRSIGNRRRRRRYHAPVLEMAVVRCYASERCRRGACPSAGLGRLLCACALCLRGLELAWHSQAKILTP